MKRGGVCLNSRTECCCVCIEVLDIRQPGMRSNCDSRRYRDVDRDRGTTTTTTTTNSNTHTYTETILTLSNWNSLANTVPRVSTTRHEKGGSSSYFQVISLLLIHCHLKFLQPFPIPFQFISDSVHTCMFTTVVCSVSRSANLFICPITPLCKQGYWDFTFIICILR